MPSFKHFSRSGTILPIEKAVISTFNIAYAYGFGVYESIRVVRGTPYFLQDHVNRLLLSASIIGLKHDYSAADIEKFVRELISVIDTDAFNIKILLIGAKNRQDVELQILPLAPIFPDKKWYRDGITVTTTQYERLFPQAKTLNMLGSFLAYDKARNADAYDCLLLDQHNCITEGTRTNFFAIKKKIITSPPLSQILDGITRMHILNIAQKNGFEIRHQSIPLDSIHQFDGAFLTSTSSKILPIRSINDFSFDVIAPEIIDLKNHFDLFLDQQK